MTRKMKKNKLIALIITFSLIISQHGFSQIDVKGKVKEKTTERANQRTDEGIDKGLNKIEEGIGGLFKKKEKKKKEEKTEETQTTETTKTEQVNTKPIDNPKFENYSKYDFIAGEQILFFDDFSDTQVGDFPAKWNTNASGEVVTTNLYPGKWLKMTGSGSFPIDDGLKLTDNFTIEFDVVVFPKDEENSSYEFGFYLYDAANPKDLSEGGAVPGKAGIKMTFGSRSTYSAYDATGYTISGEKDEASMEKGKKYRLSFWVQKSRLRVYLEQVKVFDLPKVFNSSFMCNMMRFELWDTGTPMISNFRVAVGLPDTRSKLITEGKLISYGITFDSGKDVLKPESYGALNDIAKVLKENPTVKIKIVGHTDSDGDDAKNLDLSKRRAANVKNSLVKDFGINGDLITTDGKGKTQEIAPNTTSEGKAKNRRVEFLKM
jgi:flagellar motor protein MotB